MDTIKDKISCRSEVWKHFIKETSTSARCILCTKVLKHGGNTTNLHNHFKNVHRKYARTKLPMRTTKRLNTNEDEGTSSDISNPTEQQSQLEPSYDRDDSDISDINCNDPTNKRNTDTFSNSSQDPKFKTKRKIKARETKITESFVKINSFKEGGSLANKLTNSILFLITTENLPLSIVDSKAFKRLINTAAPLYTVPSRRTITRLIDAKYDILKANFKEDLKLGSTYTLTCDIWTDLSNQSYLGVTIHYLRHELILTNATIGVFPLTQNHTANYIKETLISVIDSFGIGVSKITALVTDSAANMIKAINDGFGPHKHLPCIAHALSHLVPDAINSSPRIQEIIVRVKSIVTVTKRSVVASDELKRLQIRDGKTDSTALKFKQDVPTRWNSTYYMLKRFLELKDYVYPVLLVCSSAPSALSREEIDILEDIVRILGPIEFVTTEISGDSYPTSSLVIPVIHCMEESIKNCVPLTDDGTIFRDNILFQIQRRFKEIESYQILAVSTILDPRFKRIHFQSPRAAASAVSYINNQLKIVDDNNSMQSNTVDHLEVSPIKSRTEFDVWVYHDKIFRSCTSSFDEPGGINLELRQFLKQPCISRNQNPFKYWQKLKLAYPTLFIVAINYLSVVATSVPSKRVFSKTGIIKSDLQSRLSRKRINSLLFLGSLSEENWGLNELFNPQSSYESIK